MVTRSQKSSDLPTTSPSLSRMLIIVSIRLTLVGYQIFVRNQETFLATFLLFFENIIVYVSSSICRNELPKNEMKA